MGQQESRRSRLIMNELRIRGAFCFKVWGSEHMMAGLPDIIGCYSGKFFGLEVKNPEQRLHTSKIQEHIMAKIRLAGGISQVVCTPQEAIKALEMTE